MGFFIALEELRLCSSGFAVTDELLHGLVRDEPATLANLKGLDAARVYFVVKGIFTNSENQAGFGD